MTLCFIKKKKHNVIDYLWFTACHSALFGVVWPSKRRVKYKECLSNPSPKLTHRKKSKGWGRDFCRAIHPCLSRIACFYFFSIPFYVCLELSLCPVLIEFLKCTLYIFNFPRKLCLASMMSLMYYWVSILTPNGTKSSGIVPLGVTKPYIDCRF